MTETHDDGDDADDLFGFVWARFAIFARRIRAVSLVCFKISLPSQGMPCSLADASRALKAEKDA
jgi:hypothetical protein